MCDINACFLPPRSGLGSCSWRWYLWSGHDDEVCKAKPYTMTAFAFSLYLSRYSEVYFITHSFRQCLMLKDHFSIIVDCRRVPNLTSCESSVGVVGFKGFATRMTLFAMSRDGVMRPFKDFMTAPSQSLLNIFELLIVASPNSQSNLQSLSLYFQLYIQKLDGFERSHRRAPCAVCFATTTAYC